MLSAFRAMQRLFGKEAPTFGLPTTKVAFRRMAGNTSTSSADTTCSKIYHPSQSELVFNEWQLQIAPRRFRRRCWVCFYEDEAVRGAIGAPYGRHGTGRGADVTGKPREEPAGLVIESL